MEKQNKKNPWKTSAIILIMVMVTLIVVDIIYKSENEMVNIGGFEINEASLEILLNQFEYGDNIILTDLENNKTISIRKIKTEVEG